MQTLAKQSSPLDLSTLNVLTEVQHYISRETYVIDSSELFN